MPKQIENSFADDVKLVWNHLFGDKTEKVSKEELNIINKLKNQTIWKNAIEKKQLVYAMNQVHNLSVAGMQPSDQVSYSQGICLGISVRWIDLRKHGKDYAHKHKFCSEVSLITLKIQQQSESQNKLTYAAAAIKSQNLSILKKYESTQWRSLLLKVHGYAVFLSREHAMAVHVKRGSIHFLDPNWGHFKLGSKSELLKLFGEIQPGRYQGPYELYLVS